MRTIELVAAAVGDQNAITSEVSESLRVLKVLHAFDDDLSEPHGNQCLKSSNLNQPPIHNRITRSIQHRSEQTQLRQALTSDSDKGQKQYSAYYPTKKGNCPF
jgi:hypothetical protein